MGMVLGSITACGTTPTIKYGLIINSIGGGSVTTYGGSTSTYGKGTVVNLVATPDPGYQFVNWTGDVGTIADIGAAITTITMEGDYEITSNLGVMPVVSSGGAYTVWLKSNGTVVTVESNSQEQSDVSGWTLN